MSTVQEIEKAILGLGSKDQVELLAFMEQNCGAIPDQDLSPEWEDELSRRVAEVESGEAVLVPHEEAISRARAAAREGAGETRS